MDYQDYLALINIVLSSGVLLKLFSFAKEWGEMKQMVKNHDAEITRLRDGIRHNR